MSITIEEITADVVPDRAPQSRSNQGREPEAGALALADRIRAAMLRERRRLDRLSDQ